MLGRWHTVHVCNVSMGSVPRCCNFQPLMRCLFWESGYCNIATTKVEVGYCALFVGFIFDSEEVLMLFF